MAPDVCLARLALGIEGIERKIEVMLRRFAGIDRTARDLDSGSVHAVRPALCSQDEVTHGCFWRAISFDRANSLRVEESIGTVSSRGRGGGTLPRLPQTFMPFFVPRSGAAQAVSSPRRRSGAALP